MRYLIVALILLTLVASAHAEPDTMEVQYCTVYVPTTARAPFLAKNSSRQQGWMTTNLFKEPSVSTVIGQLQTGTPVVMKGERGSWSQVTDPETHKTGWIPSDYLFRCNTETVETNPPSVFTVTCQNIETWPKETSKDRIVRTEIAITNEDFRAVAMHVTQYTTLGHALTATNSTKTGPSHRRTANLTTQFLGQVRELSMARSSS